MDAASTSDCLPVRTIRDAGHHIPVVRGMVFVLMLEPTPLPTGELEDVRTVTVHGVAIGLGHDPLRFSSRAMMNGSSVNVMNRRFNWFSVRSDMLKPSL